MTTDPASEAARLLRSAPPMVVLRPGDRVLIVLHDDPAADITQDIAVSLRRAFPGVEFTVLTGVASIAVQGGR